MTLNAKIINLPSLGFSGSISEACRKFNVPLHVFCSRRYHHKWDIEKCFSTPVRKKTCFKTNMKPKNICIHFKDDEEYKCLPELMKEFNHFIRGTKKEFKYFTQKDVELLKQQKEGDFETMFINFSL